MDQRTARLMQRRRLGVLVILAMAIVLDWVFVVDPASRGRGASSTVTTVFGGRLYLNLTSASEPFRAALVMEGGTLSIRDRGVSDEVGEIGILPWTKEWGVLTTFQTRWSQRLQIESTEDIDFATWDRLRAEYCDWIAAKPHLAAKYPTGALKLARSGDSTLTRLSWGYLVHDLLILGGVLLWLLLTLRWLYAWPRIDSLARYPRGCCQCCGYEIGVAKADRCPECGTARAELPTIP
jgi:hypothetical protein